MTDPKEDLIDRVTKRKDLWYVARDLIEHEDQLINHRLTHWAFSQGFLIGAAGLLAKGVYDNTTKIESKQTHPLAFIILFLFMCGAGLFQCWLANKALFAAHCQIRHTRDWWLHISGDGKDSDGQNRISEQSAITKLLYNDCKSVTSAPNKLWIRFKCFWNGGPPPTVKWNDDGTQTKTETFPRIIGHSDADSGGASLRSFLAIVALMWIAALIWILIEIVSHWSRWW